MAPGRRFAALMLAQTAFYIAWCINTRAVARADYLGATWTDVVYNTLMIFVFRSIAEKKGSIWLEWSAMCLGGILGTLIGIRLSL